MFRILAFFHGRRLDREFLLPGETSLRLGREETAEICTGWDPQISREHAVLRTFPAGIRLTANSAAANPIFVNGEVTTDTVITPGQSFVVGGTRFEVQMTADGNSDQPSDVRVRQLMIDRQHLSQVQFSDAPKKIEVLTSLPAVIRQSGVERDLHLRLCSLLLAGIPAADGAAVVELDEDGNARVLQQEQRFSRGTPMHPSHRLAQTALLQQRTVLHISDHEESSTEFTQVAGFAWGFCTPFSDGSDNRGLYLTGRGEVNPGESSEQQLHADIRFSELIADIISALEGQRRLERQQSGLRQFFSPPVLETLGKDFDTSLLSPRECDVTVLFCDLRGFSHRAEIEADNLTGLLERVSMALEVMTDQILRFGGVTGDFQGDAALGFWGWPIASEEAPLDACRAALAIHREFRRFQSSDNHPLKDFDTSVGVAHGRAVAGKIGTRDQVKVTVFGPVVNLASRLEAMTRDLRVSLLIDDNLEKLIRDRLPVSEGRIRQLLPVLPYGMDRSLIVSELIPPINEYPLLQDQHLRDFETGLQYFQQGDWEAAWRYLHSMPADDRAQDFLSMLITKHDRRPPPDWDGIVRMKKKS